MEFNEFAFWLLTAVLSVIAMGVGWFLVALIGEIKGMREEMGKLNEKLAHVVVNQDWHAKEILRLERRIDEIEPN